MLKSKCVWNTKAVTVGSVKEQGCVRLCQAVSACVSLMDKALSRFFTHLPFHAFDTAAHCLVPSYHELREGLKKMRLETPMLLTEQEYDVMTEHGTLCDDEGEIDQACFQVPCCANV